MLTELTEASLAGPEAAPAPVATVEAWYDEHAAAVFGLALRMMHDMENAERLVVAVFVQAQEEGGQWPAHDCRGALLHLTRQAACRQLREQRASQSCREEPRAEDAGRSLTSAETRRTILDLAFFEGYTNAELAVRFAMTIGDAAFERKAAFVDVSTACVPTLDVPGNGCA